MSRQTNSTPFSGQRLGVLAIILFILAFAGWMWLAPLHSAVVTAGQVKTATNRTFVQHTDGGVVKDIRVRNGDSVKAGQVLLELENVSIDANQELLRELVFLESIKLARLDAEQQLEPNFALGEAELDKAYHRHHDTGAFDRAYLRELKIFRTRRHLLDEQLASYQQQLQAVIDEQQALDRQKEATLNAVRLARDELDLNAKLVDSQYIPRARLLSLERMVAELSARQGEHEAMLAKSVQRKNDLQLRIAATRNEYQRIAAEEYKAGHQRLVELRERLRPAEDAARRKAVLAPVSGKVVNLRINSPGEVAAPREPLMELVPDDAPLLIEARVGVDAIKHLHLGQPTELRFTTFNARTTPLTRGDLTYISADALADRDGIPRYTIQVEPRQEALENAGIATLKPGMAAEVYVLVESRTVLEYLLAPIHDTLRRSLREP
ncbi:HlyD family type I secretion periplasmic adaptor subunit [Motiliproteus sp. SC1-56]|uniref:HlyD family type I secretion periplasmic adaptor subunit n=1 Tax=Motiliproteus sp. SC1-56 TaxID=2799565 RepID=UPI001A8F38D8|nr:HlyD family type I secretion periplasmic adaptor subunit [Motiliproteus sp. SC1-56]